MRMGLKKASYTFADKTVNDLPFFLSFGMILVMIKNKIIQDALLLLLMFKFFKLFENFEFLFFFFTFLHFQQKYAFLKLPFA